MPPAIEAIPLRPDDVPDDFVCAVCLSVPVDPWVVRECHHVFCEGCIRQCLRQQKRCPVCRIDTRDGTAAPMRLANPLAHRVWSGIDVRCPHHDRGCTWTGSISDCAAHAASCRRRDSGKILRSGHDATAVATRTADGTTVRALRRSVRKHEKYVRRLLAEAERKDRTIERSNRSLKTMNVAFQALSIDTKMKDRRIQKLCAENEKKDHRYRALEKQTRERLEYIRDAKKKNNNRAALDTTEKNSETAGGQIFVDYNVGDRFVVLAREGPGALPGGEPGRSFAVTQVHTNGTISFHRGNNITERIDVRNIEICCCGSTGADDGCSNPAETGSKDDAGDPPDSGAPAVAERYLSEHPSVVVRTPRGRSDHPQTFSDSKDHSNDKDDAEIRARDGSRIHRENMREIFAGYNFGDESTFATARFAATEAPVPNARCAIAVRKAQDDTNREGDDSTDRGNKKGTINSARQRGTILRKLPYL